MIRTPIAIALCAAIAATFATLGAAPAPTTAPGAGPSTEPTTTPAAAPGQGRRGGRGGAGGGFGGGGGFAGGGGGARGGGAPAVAVTPLESAVAVEIAPPLDKEHGNFKVAPKTTWRDVKGIEVAADVPRGTVIPFTVANANAVGGRGGGGRNGPPGTPGGAAPAGPGAMLNQTTDDILALLDNSHSTPETFFVAAGGGGGLDAGGPGGGGAPGAGGGRGGRGGRGGGPGGAGGGGRACWVYIPAGYKEGTELPFMVDHDGAANAVVQTQFIAAMDNLIAEKKIPMMAGVFIAPVSRSQEYDTVSGKYADYIETEVLPLAEKTGNIKLSKDPNGRGAIGQSSGAPAALGMAWFHDPAFTRLIMYSPSVTQIQKSATAPKGAQEYQDSLIPNSEKKPLRIWMEVGSNDLNNQYGSWPQQNNNLANALNAKGYEYQFLWAEGAGHVEGGVERQTMTEAMEWVWKTYKAK